MNIRGELHTRFCTVALTNGDNGKGEHMTLHIFKLFCLQILEEENCLMIPSDQDLDAVFSVAQHDGQIDFETFERLLMTIMSGDANGLTSGDDIVSATFTERLQTHVGGDASYSANIKTTKVEDARTSRPEISLSAPNDNQIMSDLDMALAMQLQFGFDEIDCARGPNHLIERYFESPCDSQVA